MRHGYVAILLFIPILVVAFAIAWFAALPYAMHPSRAALWPAGLYDKKESAAHANGNKIVLVGGSGAHFSFSAEDITHLSGRAAVNLASHAGLGADYILYRARRSLRPGDVAILALEYTTVDASSPAVSDLLAEFVAFYDQRYVLTLGPRTAASIVMSGGPVWAIKTLVQNFMPWSSPLFIVETVNQYGDETANTVDHVTPAMRQHIAGVPPLGAGEIVPRPSIAAFVQWARQSGVLVLAVWPPTIYRAKYMTRKDMFESYARMYSSLGVPILGQFTEFLLNPDQMLDTEMHANSLGREVATAALAKHLCRELAC
jgi:hypothetical protein